MTQIEYFGSGYGCVSIQDQMNKWMAEHPEYEIKHIEDLPIQHLHNGAHHSSKIIYEIKNQ